MELIVRIDSREIENRLSSSLIYGNDLHLEKMHKLCTLISSPASRKMLATLDFSPTILLYGPPNTGKTTLAYRLLRKLKESNNNTNLYALNFSRVMSAEYGETSKNISRAFEALSHNATDDEYKILVIDEIDQFCMSRSRANEHDASRRAMSVLMLELDKIHPSSHPQMVVIAMTNVESSIDSAITRRFCLKLKVNEKLDQADFNEYIGGLVKCIDFSGNGFELNMVQADRLYQIYKNSKITIPDIKGIFRNIILEDERGDDALYSKLEYQLKSAYSSVENTLEYI